MEELSGDTSQQTRHRINAGRGPHPGASLPAPEQEHDEQRFGGRFLNALLAREGNAPTVGIQAGSLESNQVRPQHIHGRFAEGSCTMQIITSGR